MFKEIKSSVFSQIQSLKDGSFLTPALKEVMVDTIIQENEIEDADMYELVLSKTNPKEGSLSGVEIGLAHIEVVCENGPLSLEELQSLNSELNKSEKVLGYYSMTEGWFPITETPPNGKLILLLQSAYYKRHKAWFVPKEGYIGPVDSVPDEISFSCSNGFTLLRLLNRDHLKTEGRKLKHCIGREDMGYISKVENSDSEFYSLRDSVGDALITIERNPNGGILQMYGKKNRHPGFGCGANTMTKPDELIALIEWLDSIGEPSVKLRNLLK